MFDSFRGLLMWSIPISHFTRVAGSFCKDSLSGIIYITINVFVMQAFVFLSGYFSKNPDKARKSAFKTFLLPYIIFTVIFYFFRLNFFGRANLTFLTPPFALWFLFSVFFYRYFLKDLVRVKHLLLISILLYVFAGQISYFDEFLALGRTISYFPFFLLGYYCTKENLEKLQTLKKSYVLLLGVVLIGVSIVLAYFVNIPVGFYLLKTYAVKLKITWLSDILMRILIFLLACGWIVFMVNVIPNKRTYLSYLGENTMPIYMFHLFIRYIVERYGIPNPNPFVYYGLTWGLASLCVFIFASPPISKAYNKLMDVSYDLLIKIKNIFIFEESAT